MAVELSSIYHDVIKDRLYTDPANSHRRRSTQTALHRLVTGLCQMLSPILAFTTDEAWEFVPGCGTGMSVHGSAWKPTPFQYTKDEQIVWKALFDARMGTLPWLEKERQSKVIGKSLEAKIILSGYTSNSLLVEQQNKDALKELLNVSQLDFYIVDNPSPVRAYIYTVTKADGQKCERCWHWETDVGKNPEHPTICGRCVEAVKQFKA